MVLGTFGRARVALTHVDVVGLEFCNDTHGRAAGDVLLHGPSVL
jgi:predicted signal transduction protein with EAL and GGDEF domain